MTRPTSLEAGGPCSIARSLTVLGERWTLLVIREALLGRTRFNEFQAALRVSTDILGKRLDGLVEAGVLERRPYREAGHRERYAYHLTPAGRDLVPIIAAFMNWGDTHLAGPSGPPAQMRRRSNGAAIEVALLDAEGQRVPFDDVECVPGAGASEARGGCGAA
ncbi:winged helix-turn-helix transcriptional regulator [Streptomyces variegatus]|uniref:winged helix-turn-helix transcriptional regulator n=1 Tax=Streptomyces variegatus TaxID=284040 RepID=UPI003C2CF1BC